MDEAMGSHNTNLIGSLIQVVNLLILAVLGIAWHRLALFAILLLLAIPLADVRASEGA